MMKRMSDRCCRQAKRGAFTLVELLTVIAIIALLIGILLPALQGARNQAKNAKTRGMLKAIGDANELFRNDLEKDFRTSGGYPNSSAYQIANDPTEDTGPADERMFGAQWLVRYLMGKDLNGYVPTKYVPASLRDPANPETEQVDWYNQDAYNNKPLERVGPYLPQDSVEVLPTYQVINATAVQGAVDPDGMTQHVIIDAFGYPVLYYSPNPSLANRPGARICQFTGDPTLSETPGIFRFADNGLFTGACDETTCIFPGWDLGAGETEPGSLKYHKIADMGDPDEAPEDFRNQTDTFAYYILNRSVYESTFDPNDATRKPTIAPVRKNSFILITAGKDGVYGTSDDVNNFTQE
jgi:prepilin-type N-terminal cleavage/methylation domain-containing protein